MKRWYFIMCKTSWDMHDSIYSDIYYGDKLIAERVDSIEAEKLVNENNEMR